MCVCYSAVTHHCKTFHGLFDHTVQSVQAQLCAITTLCCNYCQPGSALLRFSGPLLFFFSSLKRGLEVLISGGSLASLSCHMKKGKKNTHDRYGIGREVMGKSTVINRCVIGCCQLNVVVSMLVIVVPSFST